MENQAVHIIHVLLPSIYNECITLSVLGNSVYI